MNGVEEEMRGGEGRGRGRGRRGAKKSVVVKVWMGMCANRCRVSLSLGYLSWSLLPPWVRREQKPKEEKNPARKKQLNRPHGIERIDVEVFQTETIWFSLRKVRETRADGAMSCYRCSSACWSSSPSGPTSAGAVAAASASAAAAAAAPPRGASSVCTHQTRSPLPSWPPSAPGVLPPALDAAVASLSVDVYPPDLVMSSCRRMKRGGGYRFWVSGGRVSVTASRFSCARTLLGRPDPEAWNAQPFA